MPHDPEAQSSEERNLGEPDEEVEAHMQELGMEDAGFNDAGIKSGEDRSAHDPES